MSAQKRRLDDVSSSRKRKKAKGYAENEGEEGKNGNDATTSAQKQPDLDKEAVDFPRGGGTTFTPLEVKAIRAEAVQEADQELFKVRRPRFTQVINES
jgi:rRNA biogenesis protein RRP5